MEFNSPLLYISLELLILVPVIFEIIFNKASKKTKKIAIIVLAFLNFALHFLKLIHPYYQGNLPYSYYKISLENICALSIVFLPFILLIKGHKAIKSFFIFISIIGGALALILSGNMYEVNGFSFESYRYIACHILLFSCGILSLIEDTLELRIKDALYIPLYWNLDLIIIFVNNFIFYKTGILNITEAQFFSRECYNESMINGPKLEFEGINNLFGSLIPSIFKINILEVDCIGDFYFPVLWQTLLSIMFLPIFYLVMYIIYKIIKKLAK